MKHVELGAGTEAPLLLVAGLTSGVTHLGTQIRLDDRARDPNLRSRVYGGAKHCDSCAGKL